MTLYRYVHLPCFAPTKTSRPPEKQTNVVTKVSTNFESEEFVETAMKRNTGQDILIKTQT
jgi:hypothetical protein